MTFAHLRKAGHALTLAGAIAPGAAVWAGPLNPPTGPVAPTPGPEPRTPISTVNTPGDADSVFKITQPGSYYLTGNITGVIGKHGLEIAASNVTVDLMGFTLAGVAGSLDGITLTGGPFDITVMNGSVRLWGMGVNFAGANGLTRVVGVNASNCVGNGISAGLNAEVLRCKADSDSGIGIVAAIASSVIDCTAIANQGGGISVSGSATISRCVVLSNSVVGISAAGGSTVRDCTAASNVMGIDASSNCTISNCTVQQNRGDGIRISSACHVRDNTCASNGFTSSDGANIHAMSTDNRIEGNNCTGADRGIDVDFSGNFIARNTCSGNTNNWDVVAGNIILVVTGTPAGAVSGNSGGTAPGSTDPNANFSY